jgi:hypothetical protein
MLLDEGEIRFIGDPEEAGRQYLRMNFERRKVTLDGGREVAIVPDFLARVSEAWLEDENGERITNVESEQPIRLNAVIEARQDLPNPGFGIQVNNADGVHVFEFDQKLGEEGKAHLATGSKVRISATIDNPLMPGRYAIVCWVAVLRNDEETAQQAMRLLNFVVFGIAKGQSIVSVPGELDLQLQTAPEPERSP